MDVRVCSKCKESKAFSEFPKDSRKKHGIRYSCRVCENARMAKYDKSEAGVKRMRTGKWKQQGIDITFDEYEERYARLEGRCEICNDFQTSLCVDHDHNTGLVRGLLCRPCNLGLSAFKEEPKIFLNAEAYIRSFK